jgi:hypothetical protein
VADAYAPLLQADRSIFAWEWLRRDPAYRAEAASASGGGAGNAAAKWGLQRFEPPWRRATEARPLWRAGDHPYVLKSRARDPLGSSDAVDLGCIGPLATYTVDSDGVEHWLVSDGLRAIRLEVVEGGAARGPVELDYMLFGRASLHAPLLTLRRLMALLETGRFARSLHRPERMARRWILALRTYDALAAGARQREIASSLLSGTAAEARWRVDAASIRSQAQRLVRAARIMGNGGYKNLLG